MGTTRSLLSCMRKSYRDSVNNNSGSRPSDKGVGGGGGGGDHPDPEIRGGGRLLKKFFRPFGPQFGLKIRGCPGPSGSSPRQSLRCFNFSTALNREERCDVTLPW